MEQICRLPKPSFQREVKKTERYRECVEFVRSTGKIPDVITLGIDIDDPSHTEFSLNGHHRLNAAFDSGRDAVEADVRICVGTMADLAREYERLQRQIQPSTTDQSLKAEAEYNPKVVKFKESSSVIGYTSSRSGWITVSMSAVLRAWNNSRAVAPCSKGKAASAIQIIRSMSDSDLDSLIEFVRLCEDAWGRLPEYSGLWAQANLTLVMWIFQQMVAQRPASARLKQMSRERFSDCLRALSSNASYLRWLKGKNAGYHRSACYAMVKKIFSSTARCNLPQPEWAS